MNDFFYGTILSVFVVCSAMFVRAQTEINSSITQFGLGHRVSTYQTRLFSMSGLSTAVTSSKEEINTANPAALSRITLVNFNVSGAYRGSKSSNGEITQYDQNFRFGGLSFSLPIISKKWGFSLTLKPYSLVGYDYTKSFNYDSIGSATHNFLGSGGINVLRIGNGMGFLLGSNSHLSLGINLNYYFGSINKQENITFHDNTLLDTDFESVNTFSNFNVELGALYQYLYKRDKHHSKLFLIGFKYQSGKNIGENNTSLIRLKRGRIIKETIKGIKTQRATILPMRLNFGISYKKKNKHLLGLEYIFESGANYFNDYLNNNITVSYPDISTLILGYEYQPKYNSNFYLQKIKYRFGAKYSTPDIKVNQAGYSRYSLTTGCYFPIADKFFTITGVSIGLEYGMNIVNNNSEGFYNTQFFNINASININSKWFIKTKYQ